jgi:hypothetical protein
MDELMPSVRLLSVPSEALKPPLCWLSEIHGESLGPFEKFLIATTPA